MMMEEEQPLTHVSQITNEKQHSSSSKQLTIIPTNLIISLVLGGSILLLAFFSIYYFTESNSTLWNANPLWEASSTDTNSINNIIVENKLYNSIDACWRNDPNWASNRKKLADCALGFGHYATGGKYGDYYVVTDESDDTTHPSPGTLRYALQKYRGSLWITFARDMNITLKGALYVPSHTTIDGRGTHVTIGNGAPCLVLRSVRQVIIHGITLDRCRGGFDGDAITVFDSEDVWIDHNSLSDAHDGLIDVVHASTDVTVSNNYFENHNKVMLMGHSDLNKADEGLRATVAYNKFGPNLRQRMPRCRFGYCHVVNNEYSQGWGIYAMGGSSWPTIVSEGNLFRAPEDPEYKKVTRCIDFDRHNTSCVSWPYKSINDTFLGGSYFTDANPITSTNALSPSTSPRNDYHEHKNIEVLDDGLSSHLPFAAFLTASAGPLSCNPGLPC